MILSYQYSKMLSLILYLIKRQGHAKVIYTFILFYVGNSVEVHSLVYVLMRGHTPPGPWSPSLELQINPINKREGPCLENHGFINLKADPRPGPQT